MLIALFMINATVGLISISRIALIQFRIFKPPGILFRKGKVKETFTLRVVRGFH